MVYRPLPPQVSIHTFLHFIFILVGAADHFGPSSWSTEADSNELTKAARELKVHLDDASSCFDSTTESSYDTTFRR